MNMSRFFLIIFQFILPLQIKAAGICRADQATTCSGTNFFFQCLDEGTSSNPQSNCLSSAPASHRAITLPVSSWVGLKQCTNIPNVSPPNGCDMQKPLIATADLNDDGLLDAVISVQLGGNHNSGPRTQYEVLLLINDGTATSPSFTTVLRDTIGTARPDPFTELRDKQLDCGCDGNTCCKDYFRSDMFNQDPFSNGFHGLMRGMPIQLVDLVGDDGLVDLVLGPTCYHNIGTPQWPKYSNDFKTELRGFKPGSSAGSNKVNYATSYHFADLDLDGDLDAFFTARGLDQGKIHMLKNIGTKAAPNFDYWGDQIDTYAAPHITEQLDDWGGDITVADFDGDGLSDVLVSGDALFSNRGSSTPQLVNLGLGKSLFAGEPMSRTRPLGGQSQIGLSPVIDLLGPNTGLGLLWIKQSATAPTLHYSKMIVARNSPVQSMTPWVGKVAFAADDSIAQFSNYGKSSWHGIRLSNAADMNGDGKKDWVTALGHVYLATGATEQSEPAFLSSTDHRITSSVTSVGLEVLNLPLGCRRSGWHPDGPTTFAPGDVNNDGLTDLFVGGASNYRGVEAWTLTVTAQDITQSVGVAVTQGSATGTLKTALTGDNMETVVITAAYGVTFVIGVDLVIGTGETATTIVGNNVNEVDKSDCWGSVQEQVRLMYIKNTGTHDAPIWTNIQHNHAEYPFGDVIFTLSAATHSHSLTPTWGDVNADGYLDVIVSQITRGRELDKARLFINNQDGTFTEDVSKAPYNKRMLPTITELLNSNLPSPLALPGIKFVAPMLVDWNRDSFGDIFLSPGEFKNTGALWINLGNDVNGVWKGYGTEKTTDSIVMGEVTASSTGCGGDNTYPMGHVFFDEDNDVAWRVWPKTGGSAAQLQMYTMLPRCTLPGVAVGSSTCGVGLCVTALVGVQYGLKCQCPSSYLGDASLSPSLNAFCATCTTGAVNSNPANKVCEACPPGFYSTFTYAAADPIRRLPNTCTPCGPGRVGPSTMAAFETGCIDCPAGRASTTLTATTLMECINCGAGQYSESGASTCTQCPNGQTMALEGAAACLKCNPGLYQTTAGNNICTKCNPGTYTNFTGTFENCIDCPKGYYQNFFGTGSCLPCVPGKYNNVVKQTQCLDCPVNTFSDQTVQFECQDCEIGKKSKKGGMQCLKCDAGEAATGTGGVCAPCSTGRYRHSDDDAVVCKPCDVGKYQDQEGQALCFECLPGEFNNITGKNICFKCNMNTFSTDPGAVACTTCGQGEKAESGSTKCSKCDAGESGTGINGTCRLCAKGQFRTSGDMDAARCKDCVSGQYQDQRGQANCLNCLPGRSQPSIGMSKCGPCEKGKLQKQAGASSCVPVPSGKIVGFGSSSFITVPPGQFISKDCTDSTDVNCNPFEVCPAGKIGTEDRLACAACPLGQTSLPGAISCIACSKGKYNNGNYQGDNYECQKCPESYYQPQEQSPSTFCLACPRGWKQDVTGESSCINLGWKSKEDCLDNEYLNDTNVSPSNWKCAVCPAGASCVGKTNWTDVKALFGWSRCMKRKQHDARKEGDDLFERCSFAAACLGANNTIVESNFLTPQNGFTREEGCSEGYLNPSRMCHQCAKGYSHGADLSGRCSKCPETEANIGAAVGGVFAGMCGLALYLIIAINDGGMKGYGDALKMIMLNYVQMIFLLTTFPIEWPEVFSIIFRVGGAVTSLGEHFVNLKCFLTDWTDAEVFYLKAMAWGGIPVFLCLFLGMTIGGMSCICHDKSAGIFYRLRIGNVMQKWHVAAVAVLYLLYPTLCTSSLSLFACRTICDDGKTYLRADLDEQCFAYDPDGTPLRHATYAYVLGVPLVLLYVFGLPLLGLILVWRLRRRAIKEMKKEIAEEKQEAEQAEKAAKEKKAAREARKQQEKKKKKKDEKSKKRPPRKTFSRHDTGMETYKRKSMQKDDKFAVYGMLFSMFRPDTWFWEVTVCLRKFVLAAIGVFGGQLGDLQVHLTSSFLMFIILFTAVVRPFDHGPHGKVLQAIELASLVCTWLTLWAGAVFISYPKCKLLVGSERNVKNSAYDQLTTQDKGRVTLAWCDGMAIGVGMIDVSLILLCMILLLHDLLTKRKAAEENYLKKKERDALIEMIEWSSNPGNRSQRGSNSGIYSGTRSPRAPGTPRSHGSFVGSISSLLSITTGSSKEHGFSTIQNSNGYEEEESEEKKSGGSDDGDGDTRIVDMGNHPESPRFVHLNSKSGLSKKHLQKHHQSLETAVALSPVFAKKKIYNKEKKKIHNRDQSHMTVMSAGDVREL